MTNRPTPAPLTGSERAALDDLIRQGAGSLNSAERNRLLRLLQADRADREQERRTAGGLERANRILRQQLKDAEAEVQRQHADCQTAEVERSEAARLSHEYRNERDRFHQRSSELARTLHCLVTEGTSAEAPCIEPVPPSVSDVYLLGPCVVVGPHDDHRDARGASWRLIEEAQW